MELKILQVGEPVLRQRAKALSPAEISSREVQELIDWMRETMHGAPGVGLAAPQIGLSIRLFITDGNSFKDDDDDVKDFKQVFINPESFTFMESIGVLAMVILGGMGSIPGAILGATGVTILNLQLLKGMSLWLNGLRQSGAELTIPLLGSYSLSQLPAQFEPAKYERMVFGLILILMMIFRPQGVLPPTRERKQ